MHNDIWFHSDIFIDIFQSVSERRLKLGHMANQYHSLKHTRIDMSFDYSQMNPYWRTCIKIAPSTMNPAPSVGLTAYKEGTVTLLLHTCSGEAAIASTCNHLRQRQLWGLSVHSRRQSEKEGQRRLLASG